jgi:hypothetical protein
MKQWTIHFLPHWLQAHFAVTYVTPFLKLLAQGRHLGELVHTDPLMGAHNRPETISRRAILCRGMAQHKMTQTDMKKDQ